MSTNVPLTRKAVGIITLHAFVGWALCGAIMGVGLSVMSEQATLIAHAIGAPIIFAAVSWFYFTRFNYTTPLQTAVIFVSFIIFVDFFLVSLIINGSLEMFASVLGTWLPFSLLFTSTYLTGLYVNNHIQTAALPKTAHPST